jgi:hypothetical protein
MSLHFKINRRSVLRGSAALSAMAMSRRAMAAPAPASRLPARGHFVIRNAFVMTMERDTGDIANADVHVSNGAIIALGQRA